MEQVKSDFTQTEEERGHPPQQTLTHPTPTHARTARGSEREISLVRAEIQWLYQRVKQQIRQQAKPSATPPRTLISPRCDNRQKAPCDSSLQTAGQRFPTAQLSRAQPLLLKSNDSVHKWSPEASQWHWLFRRVTSSATESPFTRDPARGIHECRAPSRGRLRSDWTLEAPRHQSSRSLLEMEPKIKKKKR